MKYSRTIRTSTGQTRHMRKCKSGKIVVVTRKATRKSKVENTKKKS